MANPQHLDLTRQGKSVWNAFRKQHPELQPDFVFADFREANLSRMDLSGADFSRADLRRADLSGANLSGANFSEAGLSGANLSGASLSDLIEANFGRANFSQTNFGQANLSETDLSRANLSRANFNRAKLIRAKLNKTYLWGADFSGADLYGADLSGADLSRTILVGTNLTNTTLKDCTIYGISVWDVKLDGAEQLDLTITPALKSTITVDNLKLAQFIYLLLNNEEIREVINTLTTKAVLILGRFSPTRKAVLDAIRMELRKRGYLPILFDFERPNSQTVRETVRTLAYLSYFIIADLTEPSSVPEELETIIPGLVVPVKPLLETSQSREFSMFKSYGVYDWVLPIYRYTDIADLLTNLQEKVIEPARQKAQQWIENKRLIELR